MSQEHEKWMRLAIEEAELARGTTGDNPWVGCVIVSACGELLGRGHTLGPGEDHAEMAAALDAQRAGTQCRRRDALFHSRTMLFPRPHTRLLEINCRARYRPSRDRDARPAPAC